MKKLLALLLFVSLNAFAVPFKDCLPEDQCQYKDCITQVVEQIGNTSIGTCREVYKLRNGKHELDYYEVKVLSQVIDANTKKATMTGTTLRIK